MFTLEIRGTAEMQAVFEQIAPREAENLMRATIGGVAGEIRKDLKETLPKRHGTLRKNIKVKRRRVRFGYARADVVVGTDAFYWRFIEYGTRAFYGSGLQRRKGKKGIPWNGGVSGRGVFMRALRRQEQKLPATLDRVFKAKLIAAAKRALKRQRRANAK